MGVFLNASKEIKSWINDEPPVQEETLTEWMLRYMTKSQSYFGSNTSLNANIRIKHILFDKTKESKNGADWFWCFKINSWIYLLLVQAKKIKSTPSKNHDGLNQNNGKQIKNLLKTAKSEHQFPIYIFYANEKNPKTVRSNPNEGAFIVNAYDIENLYGYYPKLPSGEKSTSKEALLKNSIGLSCLDCITSKAQTSGNTRNCVKKLSKIGITIKKVDNISKHEFSQGKKQIIYRFKEEFLPEYISSCPLLKKEWSKESINEWKKEHHEKIKHLNGIAIFDFNNDSK